MSALRTLPTGGALKGHRGKGTVRLKNLDLHLLEVKGRHGANERVFIAIGARASSTHKRRLFGPGALGYAIARYGVLRNH